MSIIQEALRKAQGKIEKTIKTTPSDALSLNNETKTSPAPREGVVSSSQTSPKNTKRAGHDPKAVAILLVLLVITAYFAASQLFNSTKSSEPENNVAIPGNAPSPETNNATTENEDNNIFKDISIVPNIVLQKPTENKPTTPEYDLNGIMYIEGSPRAIVNNSMVEVGDSIAGARVVRIERSSVTLRDQNNSELTLNLK